jgi:hypothetical protein
VLVAAIAVFYFPGPGIPRVWAPGCTTVLVVGLRGNGDTIEYDHGMGGDSWAVAERVGITLSGRLDVAFVGFTYNSGPWWRIGGHIESASIALSWYLSDRHRKCPSETLTLIGQSEGAAVVHLTLPSIGSQLAAAVLLADPLRVANSAYDATNGTHDGILTHLLLGAWRGVGPLRDVVPASMTTRVRSYCLRDDPVCDPSPATLWQRVKGTDVHTTYRYNPDCVADRAASFAASRLLPNVVGDHCVQS